MVGGQCVEFLPVGGRFLFSRMVSGWLDYHCVLSASVVLLPTRVRQNCFHLVLISMVECKNSYGIYYSLSYVSVKQQIRLLTSHRWNLLQAEMMMS